MKHVGLPLPDVNIAILEEEAALAIREIVLPHALVTRAVWPPLDAEAVARLALPLTSVDDAGGELNGRGRDVRRGAGSRRADPRELAEFEVGLAVRLALTTVVGMGHAGNHA